ncbi:hypothetical protein RRG08_042375 [Elysia crispata]|uniref:Uncharacterized protein n=1 Tax=Elysia crispata TaxID=231223 RepID=A0AAE0ZC71_9GAST|nr:hypothetical protein RRG08_042375 [Elysia crispata]
MRRIALHNEEVATVSHGRDYQEALALITAMDPGRKYPKRPLLYIPSQDGLGKELNTMNTHQVEKPNNFHWSLTAPPTLWLSLLSGIELGPAPLFGKPSVSKPLGWSVSLRMPDIYLYWNQWIERTVERRKERFIDWLS